MDPQHEEWWWDWDALDAWEVLREERRRACRAERAGWAPAPMTALPPPVPAPGDALLRKRIALNTL